LFLKNPRARLRTMTDGYSAKSTISFCPSWIALKLMSSRSCV